MRRFFLITLLIVLGSSQADARPHPRHHRHHIVYHASGGIVTAQTVAGPIRIAASVASRFVSFIADLVNETGYRPRHIGCFAASGHIRHSLHHVGAACDFDQTGWNRTAGVMYTSRVTAIAHRHGLTSGCEFRSRRDCGHISTGR